MNQILVFDLDAETLNRSGDPPQIVDCLADRQQLEVSSTGHQLANVGYTENRTYLAGARFAFGDRCVAEIEVGKSPVDGLGDLGGGGPLGVGSVRTPPDGRSR